MPNYCQNKNKSKRLKLSYGELTGHQADTSKLKIGLSLAEFKSFTSPWRSVICRHLWQEYFTVYAALDDYCCKAVQANAVVVGSNASSDPCLPFFRHYLRGIYLPVPISSLPLSLLFFHPSISLSLLWENFLLSMNSTVTTPQPALTPIITSTVTLAPEGFPATRC